MQTKPPKVQIAGAGIAGLTTGFALQKIGIEVEIAPHAARLGGGVRLPQVICPSGKSLPNRVCDVSSPF